MKQRFCICIAILLCMLTACGNQESQTNTQLPPAQENSLAETQNDPVEIASSKVEPSESAPVESEPAENSEVQEENTMKVTIENTVFTATLADNSSAEALKELLADGPLTIHMSDYGNMEKVGPIGQSLPENNEQITTEAGDIILYLGNSLVIYYDTNSWNFTRIGKINDVAQDELKAALGSGSVTVTFELEEE